VRYLIALLCLLCCVLSWRLHSIVFTGVWLVLAICNTVLAIKGDE
jgi:uncharacterized membrane protein YhaH (DUF805 family)